MSSVTGIELGPDSCLLAGVRPLRGGDAEILALRRLEGPYWPSQRQLIVPALETIRRIDRLPRRACVVAWQEAPEEAPSDATGSDVLESIAAAGFRITSVLSPPQALARLAIARPRSSPQDAVAWLALNKCGAAIAIVRGGDLLFSRTFPWIYQPDLKTSKAQALQRYTLVAHLAPELVHGMDVVRDSHGVSVGLVVTCGDLPDLRSLTMPLIEELDLEVETLDSTDGFHVARGAAIEGFAESASAVRLAAAAALAPVDRSRRDSIVAALLRTAAVVGLIAVAWGGYSYWHGYRAAPSSRASSQEPAPLPIATQGRREPNRATPATPPTTEKRTQQSERPAADRKAVAAPSITDAPLLREPLPRIDTVLIDQDRRLALVDGGVVAVGDAIGSRVVIGIERDAVVLREPSGRTIKVRVRSGTNP